MKGLTVTVLFVGWLILFVSPTILDEPLPAEVQDGMNVANALRERAELWKTNSSRHFTLLKEGVERRDVPGTRWALEQYFLSEFVRTAALKNLAETILLCDQVILTLGRAEKISDNQFRAYWFWRKEVKKSFSMLEPADREEVLKRAERLVHRGISLRTRCLFLLIKCVF